MTLRGQLCSRNYVFIVVGTGHTHRVNVDDHFPVTVSEIALGAALLFCLIVILILCAFVCARKRTF